MPIIEGIGDEVIHFFVVLILFVVGIIAWRSTGLSDRQIIRTVLILERRSRHQVLAEIPVSSSATASAIENNIDTGQEASAPDSSQEEVATVRHTNAIEKEDESSPDAAGTSQDVQDSASSDLLDAHSNNSIPEINVEFRSSAVDNVLEEQVVLGQGENVSSEEPMCVVRQRRLAFFQGRQETLLETPSNCQDQASDFSNEGREQQEPSETSSTDQDPQEPPLPGNIRIRLKYLNDDQKLVEGRLQELLGDFKRRHFALELAADKLVRLIFNGQVLQRDSETLQSLGLFDNCVVHCLVHQQRTRSSSSGPGARASRRGSGSAAASGNEAGGQREWDLGNLLFVSLSVILALAWYCRYQYATLFNTTTTVALAGMTGVLAVSLVGLYLPDPDLVRH